MTTFVFIPPPEIHAARVQTGFQVMKGRKTLRLRVGTQALPPPVEEMTISQIHGW